VQTFRNRRAGLSATAGLSCFNSLQRPRITAKFVLRLGFGFLLRKIENYHIFHVDLLEYGSQVCAKYVDQRNSVGMEIVDTRLKRIRVLTQRPVLCSLPLGGAFRLNTVRLCVRLSHSCLSQFEGRKRHKAPNRWDVPMSRTTPRTSFEIVRSNVKVSGLVSAKKLNRIFILQCIFVCQM